MSDSKNFRSEAGRRAQSSEASARAKGDGWEAYSSWLNRVQKNGNGRHSAITRNLYSWNNYKNWADKIRNSWDEKK